MDSGDIWKDIDERLKTLREDERKKSYRKMNVNILLGRIMKSYNITIDDLENLHPSDMEKKIRGNKLKSIL